MKGHEIVVAAAARLAARGVRPHFVFIGRGPMEHAVRDAIERAGLGAQFTFAGFVDDLPVALAALDVVLYTPLDSDGMSRVIFEYLAAGRPLVAARVGVVPEVLIDGEHAALVPGGDAPAACRRHSSGSWATRRWRPGSARAGGGSSRRDTRELVSRRALEARYTSLVSAGTA